MLAGQSNNSAITVIKALMNHDGKSLPVMFPEPYVGFTPDNSDSNPANDAGFRTVVPQAPADLLSTIGWRMAGEIPYTKNAAAPLKYREIKIHVVNPATSNITARYANLNAAPPYDMALVTAKAMQANTVSTAGVTVIGSIDMELSTPDPGNPAREIKSKIRFDVPPPPAPTCTLDLIDQKLVLAVNGVVTSATIDQSSPGTPSAVIASVAPMNNTPANSVFEQNVAMLTRPVDNATIGQTETGPKGEPPLVTFTGTVRGPQSQESKCATTKLTTVKLGMNFEDVDDGGDMDFNDAVLCFKGVFRYSSDFVESAKDQDVELGVTNRSACDHWMSITIRGPDGADKKVPIFSSKQTSNVTVYLKTGDRLLVQMTPITDANIVQDCKPWASKVTKTRRLGDRITTGTENFGRYGVQLLQDVCKTTGK